MTERREATLEIEGVRDKDGKKVCIPIVVREQVTEDDRRQLAKLASGRRRLVEIGTFIGGSAQAILEAKHPDGVFYTVDDLLGMHRKKLYDTKRSTGVEYIDSLPPWIIMEILRDRLLPRFGEFNFVWADSVAFSKSIPDGWADFVFIDGSHVYNGAKRDIDAWLPKVGKGGIICGHDYDKEYVGKTSNKTLEKYKDYIVYNGTHPGVALAVRESFESFEVSDYPDSTIWWVEA